MDKCQNCGTKLPDEIRCDYCGHRHQLPSSASPACSIAWSYEPPAEKGMYLWRTEPGVMLAIVYTTHVPGKSELIGKVYGHGERHFYEACSVGVWGGQWLGPLPTQ